VNTIGSYKGTNIINVDDGDNVKALKIFSGLKISSDHRRPFNRQLRPAEGWPSCNSSRPAANRHRCGTRGAHAPLMPVHPLTCFSAAALAAAVDHDGRLPSARVVGAM